MKKIVLFFVLSAALIASHVNWLGNYNKALLKAKKENKPLFILLIKNNCSKCKDIVKEHFTNTKYVSKINSNYIPVIANYDSQDYPNELIYTNTFPTLFILNPKNELLLAKPAHYKDIKKILDDNLL